MIFINESTPIIAVNTKQLTAGQSSIVYVSSTSDIGQLTTVFDIQGFLSAPQTIIISSLNGCDLGSGVSSIGIQQRFGYVTLRSLTNTRWAIVNENAFRNPGSDYNIKGIQYSTIQTSNALFTSTVDLNSAVIRNLSTTTATFLGPLLISSFGTNTTSTILTNTLFNTSNYTIQSSLYVVQGASILSGASTLGTVNITSNLNVNAGFTTASTMYLQSSLITSQRILVGSNITIQGLVNFSSNVQCFTNASTTTTTTSNLTARTISTNNVLFDSAQIYPTPDMSLYLSSSLTAAFIQTSSVNMTSIATSNVSVLSSIYTPAISIINTNIRNIGGFLSTSSIYANTAQYSRLYGYNQTSTIENISTQASYFSNILTLNNLYVNKYINIYNGYFGQIFSNNITADVFRLGGSSGIDLDTLSLSTVIVSSAIIATQMSSFVAPNSRFIVSKLNTKAATILGPVITSSLTIVNGIHDTTILRISTPVVSTASISANLFSTAIGNTSTLSLSNAILGPTIPTDPMGPIFVLSTFSGFTSNTPSQYIQGSGTPFSPFHAVISEDSRLAAYISGGTKISYITMNYSYMTTALSTTGTTSIILKNPIFQSTLITFSTTNARSFQTYSLSNYSVDTEFISSTIQYNLFGPTTYSPPSTLQSQQTLIASGQSAGVFKMLYSSDAGTTLTTLPYVGFETATYGIAFGGSKWVAVGNGDTNTIIISYTGTTWYNLGKTVFSTAGLSVSWNGTVWVATGQGTNTIAVSYDGITWVGQGTSIFSVKGWGATSDGTNWIAVGEGSNTIARSTNNGATWSGLGISIFSVAAYSVAWNGSIWIAVGQGTNTIARSSNGITWIGQGTTVFHTSGRVIVWNGSYWLAGSDTQPLIGRSSDGTTWTTVVPPLTEIYTLAWTGTQWVAGGQGANSFAVSADGLTWTGTGGTSLLTKVYTIATRAQSAYTPPPPLLIIGGQGTNLLATSTDSITWVSRSVPMTSSVKCVAWNGNLWVAGGAGTYVLATSLNGINWTAVSIPNMTAVFSVAWGPGKWIAVGLGSGTYTRAESSDGITWTPYTSSTGGFFTGAAYGIIWSQGIWLAAGTPNGSGILFSLDGENWIPQIVAVFTTGRCVSSNGTLFLSGGSGASSKLAYSLEGTVWSALSSPFTDQVNAIAWGESMWVAVGQGTHTLAYSYNGITWIGLGTSIFSTAGNGVVWTGSGWIATGQGTNTLATSLDGITWVGQGSTTITISGICASPQLLQPNTTIQRQEPVGIRWVNSGALNISPTIIEKPPRANPGYDSYSRSMDGYINDALLQFRPFQLNGSVRIGLTTSATPLQNLSYAFSLTDTGELEIWTSGTFIGSFGNFAISDTLQITYNGVRISLQQNSLELYSVARSIGSPLFLEAQFNLGGTRLYDLEFHPLNKITEQNNMLANQYYTTVKPSGLLVPSVSFTRPISEPALPPSLWNFAIPMSGTLATPSSMLYADVYLNSSFLFSTTTLQTALNPTPSTYNLYYTLSTFITTTPADTLKVNIYSQHSRGVASIYSTSLTTYIYNLSSVQYVELIHRTSTGTQTTDLSLWIRSVSTPLGSYVNSNAGIEMNRGFMRWNGRQYGITIQNPYNDLQTRTLTYTGALYTASDSNLKHDIGYADTANLYRAIDTLPLHRYSLLNTYRDRFHVEDAHQLGVLTTEVAAKFPTMIKTVDSDFVPDLQTVDRAQFRYAHLGATQNIMGRLSTLKSKINTLFSKPSCFAATPTAT